MNNFYPLASTTWDSSEITAINNVISSGNYSMGKYVKLFEDSSMGRAFFIESRYFSEIYVDLRKKLPITSYFAT